MQYMDPAWKTSWGLGFAVFQKDKDTFVGHGGSCPGYKSSLQLRPKDELATIVMDNAAEEAGTFTGAMFAILDKRKGYEFKEPAPATGVDLEAYSGHYSEQPWGSESVIVPWAGGLAYMSLPSREPADGIMLMKPKGGDLFRRVRDDGTEAEEIKFERDASGKVTGFEHFSNHTVRIP